MLINIFRIYYLINIYFCNFRSALISAAPNSAIALHSVRHNPEGLSSNKNVTILVEPFVFDSHSILLSLNMYDVVNLGDCCQTIYDSKIKLKDSPINIRSKSLIESLIGIKYDNLKLLVGGVIHYLLTTQLQKRLMHSGLLKPANIFGLILFLISL